MRVRIFVVAMATLAFALLTTGAHATGNAAACQLVGTVQLSQQTDVQTANQGSGSFNTATSSLTCAGSLVGTAQIGGSGDTFHFCRFGGIASSTNPACHNQQSDALGLDALYAPIDQAHPGLVAYFEGGPVTVSSFELGGPCTFSFNGYAIAANATIHITSFSCTGLPNMTGEATATSIPEATNPCGQSLCFQDVVFAGTIEVHD
ncbi:MAG: hypothetical protein ACYDCC_06775 [Actinomycetota bacterium]